MKLLATFFATFLALVACAVVTASPHAGHDAAAATNTTNSTTSTNTTSSNTTSPTVDPNSEVGTLIAALKGIGGFNILAGLLSQYPDEIGKIVSSGKELTLLAPNDAALGKLNATLSKTPRDVIFALLSYHVVLGTYPSKTFSAANHTVVPTLLSNSTYVSLGTDVPQRVVISKNAAGVPVVVTNEGNITFVKTDADITTGKLSLYPITGVLTIPGNLTMTLKETNFTTLATGLAASNLSETLNNAHPLTIFAPTNAAFVKAQAALQSATPADRVAAFSGHFLNGTVAYSTDLWAKAQTAMSDMSTMRNGTTHYVGTLIAAGGQAVNLTVTMDGELGLVSGNSTAKIVSTDHLYNGGVVHGIDAVLLNTALNPEAAAKAAANNKGATGGTSSAPPSNKISITSVSIVITALSVAAGVIFMV